MLHCSINSRPVGIYPNSCETLGAEALKLSSVIANNKEEKNYNKPALCLPSSAEVCYNAI
jgi:hypothetical protein